MSPTVRNDQPTNADLAKQIEEISAKLNRLISAAQMGGGLVPPIDYVKLRKLRKKVKKRGLKFKCKPECRKGPCRYGAGQALKCLEQFEKFIRLLKRRKEFASHIPYTKKILLKLNRRDLLTIAGIVGVNIQRILNKGKGHGSKSLIDEIIRLQPRWIEIRDRMNKVEQKQQEKKAVQTLIKQPESNIQLAEGTEPNA